MSMKRYRATGFNQSNQCAEVVKDDHGAWVLHDDVAELQRDAERYKWLREREMTVSRINLVTSDESARLDEMIDAAMKDPNARAKADPEGVST